MSDSPASKYVEESVPGDRIRHEGVTYGVVGTCDEGVNVVDVDSGAWKTLPRSTKVEPVD